jgi:hypothetical protein
MGKVNLEFLKDDMIKYEITGKNQEDIVKTADRMLKMLIKTDNHG